MADDFFSLFSNPGGYSAGGGMGGSMFGGGMPGGGQQSPLAGLMGGGQGQPGQMNPQMLQMIMKLLAAQQMPSAGGGMGIPIVRPPPTGDNMVMPTPPGASNMPMINPYSPAPQMGGQQGLGPLLQMLMQQSGGMPR